jgi:hypothetical protein
MSPREFVLRLETIERPFRVIVTALLRRVVYLDGSAREIAVDVAFPVEFASLEHVLADLSLIRARISSAS